MVAENGEDRSKPTGSRSSLPRRSQPAPRIQQLAQRFEQGTESGSNGQRSKDSQPWQGRRASIATASLAPHVRPSTLRKTSLPPDAALSQGSTSHLANDHPHVVRAALGAMNWNPLSNVASSSSSADTMTPLRSSPALARHSTPILFSRGVLDQHVEHAPKVYQSHLDPSPAQPFPPSVRQIDARPVGPLTNISLEMARIQRPKRVDGLPAHSGTTIPDFPEESLPDYPLPPPSSSPSCGSESSTRDDGNGKQLPKRDFDDDRAPLVDHIEREQPRPAAQAIPASEIFGKKALQLHLPDLDSYLSDTRIFPPPKFSTTLNVCTTEEARLYGLHDVSPFASKFEVCGDQIALPASSVESSGLRKRRTHSPANSEDGGRLHIEDSVAHSSSVDTVVAEKVENKNSEVPSSGIPVTGSTRSKPNTRLQMFPPLMLLKDNSLDELKSNAVGPRKPPGGFLPGLGSILGTIVDFVVGVEGSTLAAGIFRLQLFIDFVQLMNLNLHFTDTLHAVTHLRQWNAQFVLLRAVPSALSLDFVSIFGAAVIIFFSYTAVVAVILFLFWRMTRMYNPNQTLEGYSSQPWLFRLVHRKATAPRTSTGLQLDDDVSPWRSTVWTKFCNISIVMFLTVMYIPLSKLAVDALVWNIDYWPVQANGEQVTAGMCYRTTFNDHEFNWAYLIVPVAALTVIFYTLWFPFKQMQTIRKLLPRVDEHNELGNRRSKGEMETEYMRMLQRDASPLCFMYNAYRRRWGPYKPLYILCFKLSNLLIISIFTQQNCLFHKVDTKTMLVIQQGVLIGLQALLLVAHLSVQPFIDMISNRSEFVSRVAYVLTAILGLLVALQIKGSTVYQSTLLYVVQALTYTCNIYFTLASTSWMSHLVKRLYTRLDFSIDIFSPSVLLDKHIKRRIWQETLSTILLSGPEYRMPIAQLVTFSINDEWPPYLLQFQGTAAERHVENLKIVKSIGIDVYRQGVQQLNSSKDAERWKTTMKRIQREFAGPDAYWQPLNNSGGSHKALRGVSSYFGKAFLVPFPPTLVMSYDQTEEKEQGKTLQLTTLVELEQFVWQNESEAIKRRRSVRMALRSLDGQRVHCPHVDAQKTVGKGSLHAWLGGWNVSEQYSLAKPIFYEEGILSIRRRSGPVLGDYNFETGFDVFITYLQGQRRDNDGLSIDRTRITIDATAAFGLRDDFELTQSVERFLHDNGTTINLRYPQMHRFMDSYRLRFYREALEKRKTMAYAFLTEVFDTPLLHKHELEDIFRISSCSHVVRHLPNRYPAACQMLLERMRHVHQTRVHKWWYTFWDDLWRQNNGDYVALQKHRQTFNPHFPTSIAYAPMPRSSLEKLLKSKKGIWSERKGAKGKKTQKGIFTQGLLNRVYFMLDEMAFERSLRLPGERQPGYGRGAPLAVGTMNPDGRVSIRSLATISAVSKASRTNLSRHIPYYSDPFATSSRHTGGGTDQDDATIIERYAWPWTEERLSGQPAPSFTKMVQWKILEWLSIRPYKLHDDVDQLYIFVRVVDGRYEAISRRDHAPSH